MVLRKILSRRTLAYASAATVATTVGGYYYLNSGPSYPVPTVQTRRPPPPWTPPSRKQMLDALKASSSKSPQSTNQSADANEDPEFDLLIVGGGATGAGVAVDAVTRGLKVALVERDDFSSGMSVTVVKRLEVICTVCVGHESETEMLLFGALGVWRARLERRSITPFKCTLLDTS
jgi:hypothetical protein